MLNIDLKFSLERQMNYHIIEHSQQAIVTDRHFTILSSSSSSFCCFFSGGIHLPSNLSKSPFFLNLSSFLSRLSLPVENRVQKIDPTLDFHIFPPETNLESASNKTEFFVFAKRKCFRKIVSCQKIWKHYFLHHFSGKRLTQFFQIF